MPETVPCLSMLTSLMVSHIYMCLLPWLTATAGCHISNVNSSNQQQLIPGYRQTSKSPNQPRKVKTTTNKIYAWQFKYVTTMSTVLWILQLYSLPIIYYLHHMVASDNWTGSLHTTHDRCAGSLQNFIPQKFNLKYYEITSQFQYHKIFAYTVLQ